MLYLVKGKLQQYALFVLGSSEFRWSSHVFVERIILNVYKSEVF